MADTVLGAQLYTIRDFTKTPADIAKSMKKIRDIGYEAVQVSGMGPIDPNELRKILDDNGLTCAATHVAYDFLRDDTDAAIEHHRILGCDNPAIGGLPAEYRNAEGYPRFAKEASEMARKLKDAGMTFSYHNHSFELEKYADRLALEILRDDSDPEVFCFEIDTYWIQHGGGDPAAWIRSVKGRIPLVHLKDMTMRDGNQIMAEIGEGNLNWPEILKACREADARWYLVEQDTCERDPFESLKISYNNLREMGLK